MSAYRIFYTSDNNDPSEITVEAVNLHVALHVSELSENEQDAIYHVVLVK